MPRFKGQWYSRSRTQYILVVDDVEFRYVCECNQERRETQYEFVLAITARKECLGFLSECTFWLLRKLATFLHWPFLLRWRQIRNKIPVKRIVSAKEEKDDISGHLMISLLFPEREKLPHHYCAKLFVQLIERNFESSFSFSGGAVRVGRRRRRGQLRGSWDFWSKHGLGMEFNLIKFNLI